MIMTMCVTFCVSRLPSHNIAVGQVMGEIKNPKRSSSGAVSHKGSNARVSTSNIHANEEQVGEDEAMPTFVV